MSPKKNDDPGTDVDVVDADVVPMGDADVSAIAQYLDQERTDASTDAVSTYRDIVSQVLSAQSVFDVLMPPNVLSARDQVGKPFALVGVRFQESAYDAGSPIYASMDVVWPGETRRDVIHCGHQQMIAQLLKLNEFNEFPQLVIIEQSAQPNRFGNYMLRLRFAEDPSENRPN